MKVGDILKIKTKYPEPHIHFYGRIVDINEVNPTYALHFGEGTYISDIIHVQVIIGTVFWHVGSVYKIRRNDYEIEVL